MNRTMILFALLLLAACGPADDMRQSTDAHGDAAEAEPETGPHGGRLLEDGGFALELALFEAGLPPEYRAWATSDGEPVPPGDIDLTVTLTRLGGVTDEIGFGPSADFLRGDSVVYEPHSFVVSVEARRNGRTHRWQYESFDGRTRIAPDIAEEAGIVVEKAGPASIRDDVTVYGRVVPDPENVSHVNARFDGVIRSVRVSIGEVVAKDQVLAVIEANDSLNDYSVHAPIGGMVTERHANPGETTDGHSLFTIVDTSSVWAELAIFPSDRHRVEIGAPITVRTAIGDISVDGEISVLSPVAGANQAITARVPLDNPDGLLAAGMYLTGEIEVARHDVPLAVRRTGLQPFRDFTVVFARIGDDYEVRMLELGRQDDTWAEVLGGLEAGTAYVTENSYVIKADIEKSGASHDH
ncbi:MAG: efflux RND transporter periplasmic adaptor subunit [Woeseiaceae bacterium]|nr:efflux RND transporter periplasmic adaptor subunit [Woeseiaceae bacterium]